MRREDILITPAGLRSLLDRPEPPVIADCRFVLGDPPAGERAWRESHLPGAHYLHLDRDLSGPRGPSGGRHPLPAPDAFAACMRRIGLGAGRLLVAYDDSRGAYAARLWWLLHYFGHAEVRILDGGWRGWIDAGGDCSPVPPAAGIPGNFEARPDPRRTIDPTAIAAAGAGLCLVDSREPRRYAGLEEPIDPVAGHIPGARNRPWQEATDATGVFLDADAQRARWADLPAGPDMAVYCGSGVTACVNLVSLALAGHEGARLYPGSWSDWCTRPGAPVATGPDPG